MPDTTKHHEYRIKYNIVEERYGMNTRKKNYHDHLIKWSKYLATTILSGFDIILNEKWLNNNKKNHIYMFANKLKKYLNQYRKYGAKTILSKLLIKKSVKNSSNWKNELQHAVRNVSPRLLVFRKSFRPEIYHSWDIDES